MASEKNKGVSSDISTMIKCPHCGFEFHQKKLECNRCGHTWIPRGEELPTACPNPTCKSPYWNKPRVRGVDKSKPKKRGAKK